MNPTLVAAILVVARLGALVLRLRYQHRTAVTLAALRLLAPRDRREAR